MYTCECARGLCVVIMCVVMPVYMMCGAFRWFLFPELRELAFILVCLPWGSLLFKLQVNAIYTSAS